MATAVSLIAVKDWTTASLGKAKVGALPNGKPSSSLFSLTAAGKKFEVQASQLKVGKPFPGRYDALKVRDDGKKGSFVYETTEAELPLDTTKLKVNFDISNAYLAGQPNAPADADYCLALARLIYETEGYICTQPEVQAAFIANNQAFADIPNLDFRKFMNSSIVGESPFVTVDPKTNQPISRYYADKKTGELRLKKLYLSATVYLSDKQKRQQLGETVKSETQVFRITGWKDAPTMENPQNRVPTLEPSTIYKSLLGGCKGFIRFTFGSVNDSNGGINAPVILKMAFMEDSTWGAGQRQLTAEEAAADDQMQWC